MKVIRIADLNDIIDFFEQERAKNYALYNGWDSFVSDASGISFINKLKAVRDQARSENVANDNAFLRDELFVKYIMIIMDANLNPDSLAYKAIFHNHKQVSPVNRFMLQLHHEYARPCRVSHDHHHMGNLIFTLARSRHEDLAWDAMYRMVSRKIKLTALEVRFILDNRQCAMGLAMCFAEISRTADRKRLVARLMHELNQEGSVLRAHLEKEEHYNHMFFHLHAIPVTQHAQGFVAALRTLSLSAKGLDDVDLVCMINNIDACNEYAHAVKQLHAEHEGFDEETKISMRPILAKEPHRALHMMQVTGHLRRIMHKEDAEKTCLSGEQVHELSDGYLAWMSSMLNALPDSLLTSANVRLLFLYREFGGDLIPLLPCLEIRSDGDALQRRFDQLLASKHYMENFSQLPILVKQPHYSGVMLDQVLRNAEHADKLINGLLIWCHEYEHHLPANSRRASVITYQGDLQEKRKIIINYFHDLQFAMIACPEKADKIAKRAILNLHTTTAHGRLRPVSDIVAEIESAEDNARYQGYKPSFFVTQVRLPGTVMQDQQQQQRYRK